MLKRSLGIGLGLFLSTVSLTTFAADAPISEEARAHFSAGVNLLQDPDGARYEEAYREFKAAYRASPSWKILGNLGISAYRLERDGEALAAFEKYLQEGKKEIDGSERAQFERDSQTIRAGLVKVSLSSDPPGATVTDERLPQSGAAVRNPYPALTAPTELGVRAGRHRFTASLPGRTDSVWEVDLEPGQKVEHVFTLAEPVASAPAPAPAPPAATLATDSSTVADASSSDPLRTWSYVSLGVGVVGLGVGTVFALGAKSNYGDANDLCPSFPCNLTQRQASERESLESDGDSKKTLSIVGFAVGGVGIATGVTLFLLSGKKKEPATAGFSMQPLIGLGSVGVSGGF
ncbi:MAG: hypothetical protein EOO73_31330 [Myxococcales bacterium]|nr:MAG: hypothetical protein EOO73_31330 [Myxococcales bacterium]